MTGDNAATHPDSSLIVLIILTFSKSLSIPIFRRVTSFFFVGLKVLAQVNGKATVDLWQVYSSSCCELHFEMRFSFANKTCSFDRQRVMRKKKQAITYFRNHLSFPHYSPRLTRIQAMISSGLFSSNISIRIHSFIDAGVSAEFRFVKKQSVWLGKHNYVHQPFTPKSG